MINLLTQEEKNKLKSNYRARLVVVALLAALVLMAVSIVALVPSGTIVKLQQKNLQATLNLVKQGASEEEIKALESVARDTSRKLEILEAKPATPPFSSIIKIILDARPAGVAITSISLLPQTKDKISQLSLRGVATTRAGLIQYTRALEGSPAFTQVESPLSNLVSDRNFNFSLVLDIKNI